MTLENNKTSVNGSSVEKKKWGWGRERESSADREKFRESGIIF